MYYLCENCCIIIVMIEIVIERNDSNQRLDRFLKKFFKKASLSQIYKIIRKDLKVNGKRGKENTIVNEGDKLSFYLKDEVFDSLREQKKVIKVTKQFKVIYEDDDMIIVSKPFGLLTHGDSREKKNHLANQVINYLISTEEYIPAKERTFAPSPVNRLDRNTTGMVIFGKNADALKKLNKMIKDRDLISKYYLTIVAGEMKNPIELKGTLEKDSKTNTVTVRDEDAALGKQIETIARPIKVKNGYTLVEVELVTGRTHQIRAHLSHHGFPIIGDVKYGNPKVNKIIKNKYGLTTQLLHAYKLIIEGKEITCPLPPNFDKIVKDIF